MARRNRTTTARRSASGTRNTKGAYIDGNAVRRLAEEPGRAEDPRRQQAIRRKRMMNQQKQREQELARRRQRQRMAGKEIQKNREKAMNMNRAFVVFLAVVCTAVLFTSIHYLQLKAELTASMKRAESLEAELSQLREDNDAYYSQVTSDLDLGRIKKIALGRLGMKYPSEEQTMTYKSKGSSYVRQYQDIPDSD